MLNCFKMAPSTSNPRVLQLPKFAVVDVMISLNGRECLASDKWEVKNVRSKLSVKIYSILFRPFGTQCFTA